MELKLDFKETTQFINERNQKSLFLFLQLPWLFSVVTSISATSQGWVNIITPHNVNNSFLGFLFRNISNEGLYIIAVALCNFVVDLLFFYILMLFPHKFEINKARVITLLLVGHLLGVSLYFIGLINENAHTLATGVMRLFFLAGPFFIFIRYMPQKYLEILLPYSLIFITLEIQTLRKFGNKSTDERAFKNSKRKIGMYIRAMLLECVADSSETDLIGLLRKQESIDQAKSNEIRKVIQDFCDYLRSSFKIHIPTLINLQKG